MSTCLLLGGAGFIGTHLARRLLSSGRCARVHIADLRAPIRAVPAGVTTSITDVRNPIPRDLCEPPEWIFNLAAVHREPGHQHYEYFETNLPGAMNACAYAEATGCRNIYFSSSISVYGPTQGATVEDSRIAPTTAYGSSKYAAEWIHRCWLQAGSSRRLVISRPGVLYGAGDPGNILRLIKAVHRGYFAFPGSPSLPKSYAYIEGLLDSIEFVMDRDDPLILYNYVENPTERLGELVEHIKAFLGSRAPTISVPLPVLVPVAWATLALLGPRTPIHPTRVRKAAMSSHIVPSWLAERGFAFRYPFLESLKHWRSVAPEDFQ